MGEKNRRLGKFNANDLHANVDGAEAHRVARVRGGYLVSKALQKRLDDMGAANRAHQAAEAAKKLKAKRSDAAKKAAATRRANKTAAAQSVGA